MPWTSGQRVGAVMMTHNRSIESCKTQAENAFKQKSANMKLYVIIISLLWLAGCQKYASTQQPCTPTTASSHGIFVAPFELDDPGSPPDPARLYGPPGAGFTSNGIVVEDAGLGGQALVLERTREEKKAFATMGDTDDIGELNDFFVNISLRGDVIPENLISSSTIWVEDAKERPALYLKLFNGQYHLLTGENYIPLDGDYDPSQPHELKIGLDPQSKKFSICINGERLVTNRDFHDDDFDLRAMLKISVPATVTEAFENKLTIGEIRVIQ